MIPDLIAACAWDPGVFQLFSENVFSPLIYYSHLTPVVVSLIFGTYLFLSNRASLLNRILLGVTLILSAWLLLDLVLWATASPQVVLYVWSVVNLLEPVIYAGFVYFTMVFIVQKDVSTETKLLIALPLLPTIILAATPWNVAGFNLTNCDREVLEGPMVYYNYLIEIGYVVWIFILGIGALLKENASTQRTQSILVVVSILILLLGFASGNIIGSFSEDWALGQIGLFVIPVSIGALTYLVIQLRFLSRNQIMAAQVLVIGLWLAVGSILFIRNIESVRWLVIAILLLLGLLGFMLMRSFKHEVQQRKEIEKLAEDLESANSRLKQVDLLKSEFLSVASHQLRAPLTAIRGYAANMDEGAYGEVPNTMKEPLQVIQESARLMSNAIEDYLNISRIEQGRMKYEKAEFDVADLAHKVVNELEPVAHSKNLKLLFSTNGPAKITADIGKIKQVITNLVDNAIKYTVDGTVTVAVDKNASRARISIIDTGVGISAEDIEKLFSKFTRARDANKVNTTGTGLGLYVAKQLTEGNGGKIWVESDGVGKGSRFIMELPV